jgi:hypothetical protein
MEFTKFITENALILVPALYVLGMVLKGTQKIPDKCIPIVLLPIGVIASISMLGYTVQAIVQGVLVVGAAVYANQLVKQINKSE